LCDGSQVARTQPNGEAVRARISDWHGAIESVNSRGVLSRISERTAISASFDSEIPRVAASAPKSRFSSGDGRTVIDGNPEDDPPLLIALLPICCKRRTLRYPAITYFSIHMHTLRSCDEMPN
jgi:hypothetical protein